MSQEGNTEKEKVDMLEAVAMQLEWQNAMLATVAYEIAQMQMVMMCEEGEVPDMPDYEDTMNQAARFREMWQFDYHPSVDND